MMNVNGIVFENFKPKRDLKNWHFKTKSDKMLNGHKCIYCMGCKLDFYPLKEIFH